MNSRAPKLTIGEPFIPDLREKNLFEEVHRLRAKIIEKDKLEAEWGAEDRHLPVAVPSLRPKPQPENVVKQIAEPKPRKSEEEKAAKTAARLERYRAKAEAERAALTPEAIAAHKAQKKHNLAESHRKWWDARVSLKTLRDTHGIAVEEEAARDIASGTLRATRQSGTFAILLADYHAWLASRKQAAS